MELFIVALLGLLFGSFVNALVWRLHNKRDFVKERSECTHCHHVLEWYDLIPVVSWALLGGKCRYCHKVIDDSPLTEIGVAVAFGISYVWWPLGFTMAGSVLFGLWLAALVLLAALFLYDLKWSLLPNALTFPLIGIGIVWSAVYYLAIAPEGVLLALLDILLGIASVAGLYGFLYMVSKGEWVGFGDVKLGVFMGLVLGWQQGLLAVMLANVLAFCFIAPGLLLGKVTRKSRIPFGPFLILATLITLLFGRQLISAYVSFAFGPTI
jgi:prepilin signal peptidase PulO-like enzyme (type II secretory pathway)